MSYSPFKFDSQTYLDSFIVFLDLSMYLMKVLKAANCAMILEFLYFPCNCSLNFRVFLLNTCGIWGSFSLKVLKAFIMFTLTFTEYQELNQIILRFLFFF